MQAPGGHVNPWSLYWTCWFLVSVAAFLGPELYCLITNNGHTLSATVWRLEDLAPGQPLWQWTALHVLISGLLAVVLIWLLLHLTTGIWH
jgi:hypothetical protein